MLNHSSESAFDDVEDMSHRVSSSDIRRPAQLSIPKVLFTRYRISAAAVAISITAVLVIISRLSPMCSLPPADDSAPGFSYFISNAAKVKSAAEADKVMMFLENTYFKNMHTFGVIDYLSHQRLDDGSRYTILHYCAAHGHSILAAAVLRGLSKYATDDEVDDLIRVRDANGDTVFHVAASHGDIRMLNVLLPAHQEARLLERWPILELKNNAKEQALHTALREDKVLFATSLLKRVHEITAYTRTVVGHGSSSTALNRFAEFTMQRSTAADMSILYTAALFCGKDASNRKRLRAFIDALLSELDHDSLTAIIGESIPQRHLETQHVDDFLSVLQVAVLVNNGDLAVALLHFIDRKLGRAAAINFLQLRTPRQGKTLMHCAAEGNLASDAFFELMFEWRISSVGSLGTFVGVDTRRSNAPLGYTPFYQAVSEGSVEFLQKWVSKLLAHGHQSVISSLVNERDDGMLTSLYAVGNVPAGRRQDTLIALVLDIRYHRSNEALKGFLQYKPKNQKGAGVVGNIVQDGVRKGHLEYVASILKYVSLNVDAEISETLLDDVDLDGYNALQNLVLCKVTKEPSQESIQILFAAIQSVFSFNKASVWKYLHEKNDNNAHAGQDVFESAAKEGRTDLIIKLLRAIQRAEPTWDLAADMAHVIEHGDKSKFDFHKFQGAFPDYFA